MHIDQFETWKKEVKRQLEIMRGPVNLNDLTKEGELFTMWLIGDMEQDVKFELSDRLDALHLKLKTN